MGVVEHSLESTCRSEPERLVDVIVTLKTEHVLPDAIVNSFRLMPISKSMGLYKGRLQGQSVMQLAVLDQVQAIEPDTEAQALW